MIETFTEAEYSNLGSKHTAVLTTNSGYEGSLTEGATYTIEMIGRIGYGEPLCVVYSDDGKPIATCHIWRFLKVVEEATK
jgi:peptide methionine sulfoxide reductase MsrA